MPGWTWLMIAAFVAIDVLVLALILPLLIRSSLRPLAERCPAVEPADDTVWKRHQSISVGSVNLGLSVNLGADPDHLHIRANRLGRVLRVPAISVPWIEMDTPRLGRLASSVQLGTTKLGLPRWAVELAMGEGPEPGSDG